MEQFFNTPGLIHIGEMIFEQLNNKSLESCSNVCLDWKKILDNPQLWLNFCVKIAPKFKEIDKNYKPKHFEFDASNILINQWKQLISETEYEITNLLKKMHSDEIQESFRPPIYMAILVEDLPLIRHLLLTYTNYFLANEKSKTTSFFDVAKSSMRTEVIEYLVSGLQHKKQLSKLVHSWKFLAPNNLTNAMKTNQELRNFLKFMLEYVVANFPNDPRDSLSRYHFLYYLYLGLFAGSWKRLHQIDFRIIALEISEDIRKPEKFRYGIHLYLLCDD